MTIRREDLVAAAAVGLLQYRQIDPLLVFLLQRDVRAQREALHAEARPQRWGPVYSMLAWIAGMLAVVTSILFGVLMTSRAVYSTGGLFAVFAVLYGMTAVGITSWLRQRGYCARIRSALAMVLASVPLAVFAWQQVSD